MPISNAIKGLCLHCLHLKATKTFSKEHETILCLFEEFLKQKSFRLELKNQVGTVLNIGGGGLIPEFWRKDGERAVSSASRCS